MVLFNFGVIFKYVGFFTVSLVTFLVVNFKTQLSMKTLLIVSTMLGVAHLNEESARSLSKL
jgi:hypothetical protein